MFRQRRSPAAAYRKSPEKIPERFPAAKTTDPSTLNDSDHRDQIVRLEAQIDELAARVESWFDPSVIAGAVAAVLAGIVAAGSNRKNRASAVARHRVYERIARPQSRVTVYAPPGPRSSIMLAGPGGIDS